MKARLIESNPAVMMGKPVIAGTRITVELILEKLAAGESIEQILESHPRLTREAVLAALEFAARALRADVFGEALRALDEHDQELDAKATRFKEEIGRRMATGPATPMDFSSVKRHIREEVEAGGELSTVALAEFDAETRFRARAALGSREKGLRLLDELDRAE